MNLIIFIFISLASLFSLLFGVGVPLTFVLLYLAIAFAPLSFLNKGQYSFDPFEPYFGLSLLFLMYGLSTVQFVYHNGVTYEGDVVTTGVFIEYILVCLLGQIGLSAGYFFNSYFFRFRQIDRNELLHSENKSNQYMNTMLGSGVLVSILLLPFYIDTINPLRVISYADAAFESRLLRMADVTAGLKDIFLIDSPILLLLCASAAVLFDNKRGSFVRLLGITFTLLYVITNFLSGWRGKLVLGAIIPILYYHYRVRRFPVYVIILGGIFVYIFINALAVMRSSADLSVMIALLFENAADNDFAFLDLGNSGELSTSSNLLKLINGIESGETSYYWGGQFISQFGAFVPRFFWPDRPLLASELFVKTFYPVIYDQGGGYGLFFHQEGYWDFGFLGVFFYALLLGYLISWVYDGLVLKRNGQFWVLLYAVLYGSFILTVVRSGFVGMIKGGVMSMFPLLLVALLSQNGSRRPS